MDAAAMGHLGTGISWHPNETEVKTRFQHGQQGSGLWAPVQIKGYSVATITSGGSIEGGSHSLCKGLCIVPGDQPGAAPQNPCIWRRVDFQSQGSWLGEIVWK